MVNTYGKIDYDAWHDFDEPVIHRCPLGKTIDISDKIDAVFGEYAHGPLMGWVLKSSLHVS
jgi:hypothetical protein